ncbi:MAG TPA: amidohydrolase [Bryobacteraceae bacterium]|nr:amidohydrolase [Bryobacteraceae bacterium]
MFFILALFLLAIGQAHGADMILTGARIYTMNDLQPVVSALAVKNGRIACLGDDVARCAPPGARRIDARGAVVVPGLIDSHVHMEALGEQLETIDLRGVASVERVAELVRRAAASRRPGDWIVGRNWDQTNWGGRFPTARDLAAAAPRNPVLLARVDGHAAWVNAPALVLAQITRTTADPPGGRILREADGAPSGILVDRAVDLVASKLPAPTPADTRRRLARAAAECVRVGLTSVHDAGVTALQLDAYRDLIAHGELPLRVYAMIGGDGPLWRKYLARGPETGERLTIRSIKLLADGALGSRGAALLEPYSDEPGNSGLLILSRKSIERVAREAVAHGFQVCTHAIGDRANRTVLDAYAAALGGAADRRFRIEHAQVVAPSDFERFRKYSLIASMQPTHATSDMRWAEARLGPERVRGAYAWRRFLSLGVPVASGSDFPVERPDPLPGFYAAVTRQDAGGRPPGGWFPEQRMSREEALRSWTLSGAFAAFEEREKGSLEPGKLADFVMLSADILRIRPAEILTTRVLMTVVGREIVYSAPGAK